MKRLIDLYPYSYGGHEVKFLILKRSDGVIYSNQWRMIGGKVEQGETAWEAARRELKEETGLETELFWSVPTINHFYDSESDEIYLIPAFAAQVNEDDSITLNHEHNSYLWVTIDEVEQYIDWPEQQRIMKLTEKLVRGNKILDDWII